MPYFNSNLFEAHNSEYFINFKNKFYEFFTFYKCLSYSAKTSDATYVIEDLKTFIRCLYTEEPLPQRDYKKLYNLLINQ